MSARTSSRGAGTPVTLGLRQNAAQFTLLVAVNALVGGLLGQERTVVPLLGEQAFGLSGYTAGLAFIGVFGLSKAVANYFAGTWGDRYGRKPGLSAGWPPRQSEIAGQRRFSEKSGGRLWRFVPHLVAVIAKYFEQLSDTRLLTPSSTTTIHVS